ncbi:MAG: glutamyl-tRNA reductase [Dermatophilaceae bacterium]|nr:glutamyl-tRNA reductase [Dermatophilaceae bacterium]
MTALACISVSGSQLPISLLERLSFGDVELGERLPALRAAAGASSVAVLSTCQRTELYATWEAAAAPAALLRALAADRRVARADVAAAAQVHVHDGAARHLLRVATGLESFVLGESEIAGQVRRATTAAKAAGVLDLELERLLAAAVAASRRAHRGSSLTDTGRSVATAAVDTVAAWNGGSLEGKRLLVVGAGSVAAAVVRRAAGLGARLTVCNRTRRHAELLARSGARVVDLAELPECLAASDVAVLATAAPRPLVDEDCLARAGRAASEPLLMLDLCVPRNVAPSVRGLPDVHVIDLADLRAGGAGAAETFEDDVARAEQAVEHELQRYLRWRSTRSAYHAVPGVDAAADDAPGSGGRVPALTRAQG